MQNIKNVIQSKFNTYKQDQENIKAKHSQQIKEHFEKYFLEKFQSENFINHVVDCLIEGNDFGIEEEHLPLCSIRLYKPAYVVGNYDICLDVVAKDIADELNRDWFDIDNDDMLQIAKIAESIFIQLGFEPVEIVTDINEHGDTIYQITTSCFNAK